MYKRQVKKVHAYGVEVKANLAVQPAKDWLIDLNGTYSWTPSINEGEKMSPAEMCIRDRFLPGQFRFFANNHIWT